MTMAVRRTDKAGIIPRLKGRKGLTFGRQGSHFTHPCPFFDSADSAPLAMVLFTLLSIFYSTNDYH